MKLFAALLATETNTFSPVPTGLNAWQDSCLVHRNESAAGAMDVPGMLAASAARRGWQISRGLLTHALPGGITPRRVYESFRDEIIADLKNALPVDAVMLKLHGAMVADGYDDCEGDLLARVRTVVGPKIPIGALLDLHCHLSEAMLEHSTILVGYKEYPHVDISARWLDLFEIVADAAESRTKPAMSIFDCRMLGFYHTTKEPMRSFVDEMQRLEQRPEILNVWLAHGFPLGDVPTTGVKVVVVTDDDRVRGDEMAEQMGRRFFEIRDEAISRPDTIKACLGKASKAAQGPITIADTADNSGAGASSDSTFFLSEMMARKIENAAIAAIWDPVAVSICKDAGVGANLCLRIGGKVDSISGDPVDVSATVIGLADDVKQKLGGIVFDLGVCAAIKVHPGDAENLTPEHGIDVVLSQKRSQPFTPDIFSDFGIDPTQKKILIVKSMQHFYAGFEPISKAIYYAGDLGSTISDVMQICYQRLDTNRFWPFVDDPFME
jgi:microcystin degradation protein MlrC